MDYTDLFLAQAVKAVTLAWWKVILMYLPFAPWAWLISTKLDKDAQRFHMNFKMWGGIHLLAGTVALGAMLVIPIFWIGWPVGMLVLISPVLIYWKLRNIKVPEGQAYALSGGAELAQRWEKRKLAKAAHAAALQFSDSSGHLRDVPLKDDPLFPIHIMAEDILGPAMEARASRLDLQLSAKGCASAQTVDGMRMKRDPLPPDTGAKIFAFLKDLAGMEIEEQRRRQTGEFSVTGPSGSTQFSLTVAGAAGGQVMRIDFDRANRIQRPFDSLGLLPSQFEQLQSMKEEHNRHGIVLLGAPSGHGLTTSAYSFITRHDAYTSNIKSLEYEVYLQIDGVDHVQWDPENADVDYASHLQSILRRDPDVVLAMDVREAASAQVAAVPGFSGPLIYVPMKAATVVDLIREWVKLVGDVKQATAGLRSVMCQRLFRKLCENCRQPYQPSKEQLKKLNLPAEKVNQLFRAGGKVQVKNRVENCPVCGGTGYLGQVGAFEVMMLDDEGRKILGTGDLKAALAHARRHKMIYLQEAALSKVVSGETSIEEVIRITAPRSKGKPPSSGTSKKEPGK